MFATARKLLHVFEIVAGDGTTNVAFGEGEKELYVTVVKDAKDPQAKGVWRQSKDVLRAKHSLQGYSPVPGTRQGVARPYPLSSC